MNWGNRLLLVFIVFAGGMIYLAYRCMHVETQLVTSEYYKDELVYQEVIDGAKSANQLSAPVKITQQGQNIVVQMPSEMKNGKAAGSIWFYCASDSKRDKHIPLQLNADGVQQIDKKNLWPGNYTVKLDWNNNNKHYYTEESLIIP